MKISKKGFTLIEVIAFFTVSMALIAGIFIGTGTAINRERYNDSVESFKSFLQEQYALTANPQSAKYGLKGACEEEATYMKINDSEDGVYRGRSNCLMYGRLIEFMGQQSSTDGGWSSNGEIRVTPVIGKDLASLCFNENAESASDPNFSKCSGVTNEDLDYKLKLSEMNDNELLREAKLGRDEPRSETYRLEWDAYVDAFDPETWESGWETNADFKPRQQNMNQTPAQGAILIVRAPFSTTIRTFIISTNREKDSGNYTGKDSSQAYQGGFNSDGSPATKNLIDAFIPIDNNDKVVTPNPYQEHPRYFCVVSADANFMRGARKTVKVTQNGGNSSAVDILSESDPIQCPEYGKTSNGGNLDSQDNVVPPTE